MGEATNVQAKHEQSNQLCVRARGGPKLPEIYLASLPNDHTDHTDQFLNFLFHAQSSAPVTRLPQARPFGLAPPSNFVAYPGLAGKVSSHGIYLLAGQGVR